MGEMLQQPFASTGFVQPAHVCRSSWWIGCPRERFTEQCKEHVFQEAPTDRQKRISASIAAEQQLTA